VKLYRVFPYDSSAAPSDKGGAFFRSGSPRGRIANPTLYKELYLGGSAQAAIAETFGRLPSWSDRDFLHATGRSLCLASYALPDGLPIFDMDDAGALVKLGLKPSDIAVRERAVSQRWARDVYNLKSSIGITWWCYYEPSWSVYGLWDIDELTIDAGPEPLHTKHPLVIETATAIVRQLV
jgi:hypothetical protein